jgi:transposase
MSRHMTGPEVAKRLGVSPATIRSWRARGEGPPFVQPAGKGTQATYDPQVVEFFIAEVWANRKRGGRNGNEADQ